MKKDIFQAIADPTRRAILLLIASQSMTPNAVADHFQSSRQAVSKHIQILMEAELVKQEKNGREIYYHFNRKKMDEIEKWIEKIKQQFETRFDQLDNLLINLKNNKQNEKYLINEFYGRQRKQKNLCRKGICRTSFDCLGCLDK